MIISYVCIKIEERQKCELLMIFYEAYIKYNTDMSIKLLLKIHNI